MLWLPLKAMADTQVTQAPRTDLKNALQNVPSDQIRSIENVCRSLVLDYAYYRDRPNAGAVANLFTKDAQLTVLGQTYFGREAIRKRVQAGQGGPIFRHMMSTIRVFVESAQSATGVSYVTVYSHSPGDLPRPIDTPLAVGEYHDVFVRTQAGWKIKERTFVPVFMPIAESD